MRIQTEIEQKLQAALHPSYLEVVNESHMHAAPPGSREPRESHFKAVIVADIFNGQRLLQQHRAVHSALGDTLGRIHALALHTYTPAEWSARQKAPDSPLCLGGSKADHTHG